MKQNYINHVVFVLDASWSMHGLENQLIKVMEEEVKHLAQRSQELDQETRVTVYMFDNDVSCLVYDRDVLRLPSIGEHYRLGGQTALVDATMQSQAELALTPEIYGDHAFLTYVLTDGQENASRKHRPSQLQDRLARMPENWTVAVLVPNQLAKHEAKKFGFPAENIAIWDADSERGVEEGFRTIRAATETFMVGRSQGIRGSRSVFSTGADAVNKATVSSTLKPVPQDSYLLVPVPRKVAIRVFGLENVPTYRTGMGFYQLHKRETIQANKKVAVLENETSKVYTGDEARALIGLPDVETKVSPDFNPDYTIFVQSMSVNRNLFPNTKLLIFT